MLQEALNSFFFFPNSESNSAISWFSLAFTYLDTSIGANSCIESDFFWVKRLKCVVNCACSTSLIYVRLFFGEFFMFFKKIRKRFDRQLSGNNFLFVIQDIERRRCF